MSDESRGYEDVCEDDEEELFSLDDYCVDCRRDAIGDHCQQCGSPLCPMCFETGVGFCKDHPDEHFEGYGGPADAYEDLRNATPEQLLEAVAWWYRQSINAPDMIKFALSCTRHGFQLAQPGGWERVAPMWLRESKKIAALDG